MHGPIFANLVLADEINRTPPKTQAALLEAMQERQVTAGGRRHALPDPFFVLATQNPIEQEGTYPLPEAQLDRFLFKIFITYPTPEEERRIYRLTTGVDEHEITPMLTGERIAALQRLVRRVPVSDHCIDYAMDLVRATRGPGARRAGVHRRVGRLGCGPACRAIADPGRQGPRRAWPAGPASRSTISGPIALPVLRHRIVINYNAQAVGESSDSIIKKLLERRPGPKGSRRCRRRGSIPILTSSPGSPTSTCARGGSSRGRSAASTAARSTASTSSSPSTASTTPATTSAGSTGGSSPAPTGITSSNTRKRATSA